MGQLEGKVAIITGSGRGIGRAAAELFAAEGASVVVNDLDQDAIDATVSVIQGAGGDALGLQGDVSKSTDVRAILVQTREHFGGLDILYNNAGIGYSAAQRFGIAMDDVVNCSEQDWQRILEININSIFLFCKYAMPMLTDGGGGSVINTASAAALRGITHAHAYVAAKGAITALTRAIAVAYGKQGLRANTICPGVIDTEMVHDVLIADADVRVAITNATPLDRIGLPDDVARVALFLASAASAFVTGETIVVDGGAIQTLGSI